MKHIKPVEEMIEEDAKSFAQNLGITVDDLKNTKVSLYDIIAAGHNAETVKAFSSCQSAYRAATFYITKTLLVDVVK